MGPTHAAAGSLRSSPASCMSDNGFRLLSGMQSSREHGCAVKALLLAYGPAQCAVSCMCHACIGTGHLRVACGRSQGMQ